METKYLNFFLLFSLSFLVISCSNDTPDPVEMIEENIGITAPDSYSFSRDGSSTISFSGQTTRIGMASELISAMKDFRTSKAQLLEMFANETANGGDASPFDDNLLNESTKSVKSKVAASQDYFSSNTAESSSIKADFENWIVAQVDEVFPNETELASPSKAGQIADGSSARYVNAKGLEYNQAVNKSLIGALMLDQIINNYLSPSVLDAGTQIADNNNDIVAEGESYTIMEHKWDEAFGYLFGATANPSDPKPTVGSDDSFLNKYLGRVEGDSDFAGITAKIIDAFTLGRAAIVGKDYELRDMQANIIQEELSKVIAVRAVYYLQQGKNALPSDGNEAAYGGAFHDLSEGFGFVYSLRFTRNPDTNNTYFSKNEVDEFISTLTEGNGFWDVSPDALDTISESIAAKFDFTVAQAGS